MNVLRKNHIIIALSIILFVFVHFFYFSNNTFYFSIKELFNTKLFQIHKEYLNLFISLFTVIGILFGFYQWYESDKERDKANINALLEEIRHNLNRTEGGFIKKIDDEIKKEEFYREIHRILKNKKILKYPNPDDKNNEFECFYKKFKPEKNNFDRIRFINTTVGYISQACSSENVFSLKNHRIYINLGHLNFSLERYNLLLNDYNVNVNESKFDRMYDEYVTWVYFRLNFMLIDLIYNYEAKMFIDKDFVSRIKKLFENS